MNESCYYVYVIKSLIHISKFYVAHTQDLSVRVKQHNSGKTKSTKAYAPWILVYSESFNSRNDAIEREKYLKSGSGRRFLKNLKL